MEHREGEEQPHDRGVPDADVHRVAEDREHECERPRPKVGIEGEPQEGLDDGDREEQEISVLLQHVVLLVDRFLAADVEVVLEDRPDLREVEQPRHRDPVFAESEEDVRVVHPDGHEEVARGDVEEPRVLHGPEDGEPRVVDLHPRKDQDHRIEGVGPVGESLEPVMLVISLFRHVPPPVRRPGTPSLRW